MPKTDQQAFLDAYMRNYAKAQAQTVSGGAGQMTSARQVGQAAMNAAKTDLPDYSGAVGGFASAYAKQVEANRKAAEKAAKQAAKEAEKAAKEAAEKQEQEQETEEKQLAGLDAYRASKAKLGGQDSGEQTPGVLKRLGAGVGAGVTGLAAGTANLADTARRTVQQRAQSMDNEAFALAVSTRDEMDAELARLLDSGLAFEADGVTPTEAYRAALLTRDAAVEMMRASEADAPERAQAVQGLLDVSGGLSDTALTGLEGLPRLLGETGISIAQNLPALGLGLINPALGLGAMAASAAGSRAAELEGEGKGLGEALGRGLVSGGIEMLTEKLPMDALLDMVKTGGKGAVRQILQQAATEGGEESVAYLANLLADAAAGDEAEFSLEELARSAAGGALSGGIMGSAGTLAGRALHPDTAANAPKTTQSRKAGSLPTLVETAPDGGNAAAVQGAVPTVEQQAAELAQGDAPQGVPQTEQTAEPQTVPGLVQAVPGSEAAQAVPEAVQGTAEQQTIPALEESEAGRLVQAFKNGTMTGAQIERLKPGSALRAEFERLAGVELPATSSETRRTLRLMQEAQRQKNAAAVKVQTLEGQPPVLRRGGQSIPERMAQGGDSITEKAPPWKHERGGQAVPDPDIPEGLKERGYAESIRRKSDLPDEIKQEFYSTPEVYEQLSNAETVRRAKAVLDKGLEPALVEYRAMLDAKDPAAVPLGYDLSKQLMQQERRDEAVELLRGMSEKLTESGQFSQAAAITLMKEDPMTALRYLQKQVDAMNREGREALKKKWTDFKLTDDEVKRFDEVQPGDQEGIRAIFEDVGKRLAKEYPVKFAEQAVEAMHVFMLLNPRTQNRNILGNAAMLPMAAGARKTSALVQAAYRMKDKDFQPTQALVVSRQAKQLAAQTWDKVAGSIEGADSDRWRNVTGTARDEREVFKTRKYIPFLKPGGQAAERVRDAANAVSQRMVGKTVFDAMSGDMSALENLRRFTYGLLELGDAGFVKKNFTDRMASYLAARGITSLEDVPDEAYVLARNEALKATFKDDNTYTKLLHDLKADLGPVGEMLFPFTKTPANVTARAVDFSPLGLAHTLSEVKKSGGDPGRVIDSLAKNLTGTTVIALGALLAKARLMTGPEDENARKAAFDRQQGKLPWAIKVGDDYFTIDWAQPAATPLVLGAAMWYAAERNDSDVLLSALAAFGDTLLEQSSLQSFSDVFGGYGGSPTENLLNIAAEVPLRMIPAAAGATARVVDPVQRVTYSGEGMLDTLRNQAVSKIPYLSKTLPAAYDTWGNPILRSGEGAEAVLAQYINPGQLGNAAVTPLDGEIQRLYEATGDDLVFPRKAEWSVKLGDETRKLTAEEYSEMQRVMGETSYEAAAGVMETDSFRALDAQGQVDALDGLYLAAKDAALTELFGDEYSVPDSRAKQARILAQYGVPGLVAWTDYKLGADADGNGSLTQEEARPWLLGSDLTPLQREYFWRLTNAQWKSGLYD